jgi:hypothetical protein
MFIVVAFLLLLVIDAMICSLMVYSFAMISNYFPRGKRCFIKLEHGFQCRSSEGLIRGCVGAIDSVLATVNYPTLVDCSISPSAIFQVTTGFMESISRLCVIVTHDLSILV